jgi:hypothetical protein
MKLHPGHVLHALILVLASVVASAQPPAADLPPQQVSVFPGEVPWQPTDEQARRLVKQTNDYLSAQDEKRFADAYASFSPSQKQMVPFDGWQAGLLAFYDKAGAFEGRTIKKITWYKNPPNERPGIYAAADFAAQYQNLTLHCGYVAWHRQMDGSFEVVHEESNTIEKAVAARMTPEMMRSARASFKC